jgi:FixJ family two-component response regulator
MKQRSRVFIIDDDDAIRDSLRLMLETFDID